LDENSSSSSKNLFPKCKVFIKNASSLLEVNYSEAEYQFRSLQNRPRTRRHRTERTKKQLSIQGRLAQIESQENTTALLSKMQNISVPFKCRGQDGRVNITLQPNHDHNHAWGLGVIFPFIPRHKYALHFDGFPVLTAVTEYPIPRNPSSGYGSLFGCIQFVKETKADGSGDWEMDIFPYAKDLKTPFATWGFNPTMFDAPAKLWDEYGKKDDGLVWRAQSYLCILNDAGMSKRVKVIPGVAFRWGYDVHIEKVEKGGSLELKRTITIKYPERLDTEAEWTARLGMLRELYPEWTFHDFGDV
jgi:hypothetical protein